MEAVTRINAAIEEFRGAFLCDTVGAGKTFVGLAVAREMGSPLIIAPASLRDMWLAAMKRTERRIPIVSTESLSKRPPDLPLCDGLIVDEAHHFRNTATARHQSLSRFLSERPILLITATPIHNSRKDLESLASLFLGAKSHHLTDEELTRLVVRREKKEIAATAIIPRVGATEWWTSGDAPEVAEAIMALPPPVPFRDSGVAERLASLGLLRQWTSSEAALAAALKRRLARGITLETSLAAGEYPTAKEMTSWIAGDDAVQLGLPGLLSPASNDAGIDRLIPVVREHNAALRRLAASLAARRSLDDLKCERLKELLNECSGDPVIAFASYEATVTAFYRRLCANGHIAAMSSRGGRIASGSISRCEIELQFSPDSVTEHESRRIDLLLTSDVLSEGVNLQRARAVVHLDIPWTPARMDQRVGRIARIGSRHEAVRVFGFRPPASCERILRGSAIVSSKWKIASAAIGADYDHGLAQFAESSDPPLTEIHESLRALLREWLSSECDKPDRDSVVAAVHASHAGFLAVIEQVGDPFLVAGLPDGISDSLHDCRRVASEACGPDHPPDRELIAVTTEKLIAWLSLRESKVVAGIADGAFLHRRRKLIATINSFAAQLPIHQRTEKEVMVARARRIASAAHGSGKERVLNDLGKDLDAISTLGSADRRAFRADCGTPGYRIAALLILVAPTPAPSS